MRDTSNCPLLHLYILGQLTANLPCDAFMFSNALITGAGLGLSVGIPLTETLFALPIEKWFLNRNKWYASHQSSFYKYGIHDIELVKGMNY